VTEEFVGGRTPVKSNYPGTNHLAVLQAVRIGQHAGFDRVVFEFRPGDQLPGYEVAYQDGPVRADPSGAVLPVAGDSALVVRMHAASEVDLTQTPVVPGYAGADRVAGSGGSVTEVVLVGDVGATLSWALGVRDNPRFSVSTLTGPPRLVVDVEVSARG
jgi:hypothetical protein